jgi:predicted PurR-regulated permease PerM
MSEQWTIETRFFVLAIVVVLGAIFVYYVRELLNPIVISALLAYVLHPAVAFLEDRTPIKRKLAVFLVFLVFLTVLAVIPATLTPAIIRQVDSMGIELQKIIEGIGDFMTQGTVLGYPIFQGVPENLLDSLSQVLHPEQVFESVQAITENVVWIIVIGVMIYYLLLDWDKLRLWGYHLIPESYHPDAIRLYRKLANVWKLYLRGQLLSMFVIGLISGVAATIIGLPGAIVIGLVAAALAVVPSVGSSFMVFVAGVVSLFSQSSTFAMTQFWFVFVVVAVFIAIHLFDNYWLRPRILGQGLRLHPALILIGVIGALTIGGALLALVIVPIISTAEIFGRYVMCRMLGADPWEQLEEII